MKEKILLISPDFPPPLLGGSLVYLHNLIENSEYDFSILTDIKKRKNSKKIDFIESNFVKNSSSPKKIQLFLMYIYFFFNLFKIIKFNKVILNISALGNGFFCYILSKLGVKVIIVAFAEELTLALNAKGISGHIKRFCIRGYKNSKAIVSVSNFARNVLIEKLNVKSDIIVIPTPVHNSKFSYINIEEKKKSEIFKILSVGRLIKRKGFDYLLKAFKIVIDKGYNVELTIIGNGPENILLEKFILNNSLQKFIKIYSNASDNFLISQYKSNDLFVLSNLMLDNGDCEGAPNVLIEAAAFGMPSIAGEEGGTSDVVDHDHTGILLDPKDSNNFANTIIELINDKPRLFQMGKQAYIKANTKHSKEEAGRNFSKVIKNLN